MSDERARRKAELLQRQREMGSLSEFRSGYFRDDVSFQAWKCTEGKHSIDILTWRTGKKASKIVSTWEDGTLVYMLPVWVHFNVGPDKQSMLCVDRLKKSKRECPVCAARAVKERSGKATQDELRDMKPKLRTLYNILVHDTTEERKKGPQVWDVSHFFMEKELKERAEDSAGEPIVWSDPEDGRQVRFKQVGKGKGRTEFLGHDFIERNYVITEKILSKCYKIDELLQFPTDEELDRLDKFYKALGDFQPDDEMDEDAPTPRRTSQRPAADDDDDIQPRKSSKKQDVEEDEDDDIQPRKSSKKRAVEEDEDDVPRSVERKGKSRDRECPEGGTYGKDFESFAECSECKFFSGCSDASEEFLNEKEAAKDTKKKRAVEEDEDEDIVPRKAKKRVVDEDEEEEEERKLPKRGRK